MGGQGVRARVQNMHRLAKPCLCPCVRVDQSMCQAASMEPGFTGTGSAARSFFFFFFFFFFSSRRFFFFTCAQGDAGAWLPPGPARPFYQSFTQSSRSFLGKVKMRRRQRPSHPPERALHSTCRSAEALLDSPVPAFRACEFHPALSLWRDRPGSTKGRACACVRGCGARARPVPRGAEGAVRGEW